MTELVLTESELNDYFRDRVRKVLVSHNSNTAKTLHIPSEEEWMQPVCGAVTKTGRWLDKFGTMYPHRPVCKDCATTEFGIEVTDDE